MSSNDDVSPIRWRRRQSPFKVRWARLNFLLQTRRKGSAADELLFQTGRQLIPLGQSGRQTFAMLRVPMAHFFPVAVPIIVAAIIANVTVIVFVIAVLFVTFAVTLSLLTQNLRPSQTFLPRTRKTIFSIA